MKKKLVEPESKRKNKFPCEFSDNLAMRGIESAGKTILQDVCLSWKKNSEKKLPFKNDALERDFSYLYITRKARIKKQYPIEFQEYPKNKVMDFSKLFSGFSRFIRTMDWISRASNSEL